MIVLNWFTYPRKDCTEAFWEEAHPEFGPGLVFGKNYWKQAQGLFLVYVIQSINYYLKSRWSFRIILLRTIPKKNQAIYIICNNK